MIGFLFRLVFGGMFRLLLIVAVLVVGYLWVTKTLKDPEAMARLNSEMDNIAVQIDQLWQDITHDLEMKKDAMKRQTDDAKRSVSF